MGAAKFIAEPALGIKRPRSPYVWSYKHFAFGGMNVPEEELITISDLKTNSYLDFVAASCQRSKRLEVRFSTCQQQIMVDSGEHFVKAMLDLSAHPACFCLTAVKL